MADSQSSFWSAVVQIIPVLLLALVVEARALRQPDNRDLRLHFRRLRARHGTSRLRDRLVVAVLMMGRVMFTGFMPAYIMLIAAVTLVLGELIGLTALLIGDGMPAWTIGLAIISIALGVAAVAISPVVVRFAQALRETDPDKILKDNASVARARD
jgi:hypothetical protein